MQTDEVGRGSRRASDEIRLDLSSPHREVTDLPPGPDTDASVASPALAEQKAIEKETDLPKDTPTETAEPDRIVTENNSKNRSMTTLRRRRSRRQPRRVQRPLKRPRCRALKMHGNQSVRSRRSKAPAQARAESRPLGRRNWWLISTSTSAIRLTTYREKAEILINFVLDRLGHVVSATIVKGSGDPVFDNAALAMMHRSDPVPPPPPLIADEGLSFTLPVVFRVKGKG